jgi:hypothetical protein
LPEDGVVPNGALLRLGALPHFEEFIEYKIRGLTALRITPEAVTGKQHSQRQLDITCLRRNTFFAVGGF